MYIMSKSDSNASTRLLGRVKWFNNKAGFGFVTVLDGDKKDEDVFVHHTGVVVTDEQYKYLVQGEYVSFTLTTSDNTEHPYQAGDVRGVCNGLLMCETRNANRQQREDEGEDGSTGQSHRRVRPQGSGPRGSGSRGAGSRGAGSRGGGRPQGKGDGSWNLNKKERFEDKSEN